ncbi:cell wall protein DAN4 [Drosophila ficusphila]|uniref:cell wall protein DAN4 n=1 Tax=Drosophila ficusphila TaxID=30025 RepID=UPI0007E627F0|nr:cell wall protein DAN4 [Drosophila ficusphila]
MLFKTLLSLLLVQYAASTCNVCQSASKVACHNETTFSVCYDGEPSYDLLSCPADYYCTDGFYTCYLNADPVCKPEEDTTTTETPNTTTERPLTTTETLTTRIVIPTTEEPTTTTEEPTTTTVKPTTTTEKPTTTTETSTSTTETSTSTTETSTSTTETSTSTTEVPTTTTDTTTAAPWNPNDLCDQATKNTFFENEDDPTCTTFITCTVSANGTHSTKVTSCKTNQYYDPSLKVCTSTKPDGCVEESTTTVATTTTVTTTTTVATTSTTTTAEPWSAEATCSTVSKTTLFANEDDPTCSTFLYCYVASGSATALIKSCKTDQYFDATSKACSSTKPDNCT